MTPRYSVPMILFLGVVLSMRWILIAVLARLDEAIYVPQAFVYFGAALVLFFIPLITNGRVPQLSLRLLHAAITVAGLAYFMSPVLLVFALRVLPSAFCATVFATLPMWLLLIAYGMGREKLNQYILLVVGISVFFIGIKDEAALRGSTALALGALLSSVFCLLLGVWVSKRLFWLHSALDLNFWSMIIAAFAHTIIGVLQHEGLNPTVWTKNYWLFLIILTFPVTGLGSYLYRVEGMRRKTIVLLTATVPLTALFVGWQLWGETPINALTLGGAGVLMYVLVTEALVGNPSQWMGLSLNNDKRQGDRLLCVLDAFMRQIRGGKPSKIQVIDLAIGGVGFRSEVPYKIGEDVMITLPLGHNWSSVTIDGRIMHITESRYRDFPWVGGVEFQNLSAHRRQTLVEFLARLSKAEEEIRVFEDNLEEQPITG